MITNLLQSNRGLNFRPKSEFSKEHEYWEQFLWLARPKLTKKLFFQLPAGVYVQSNCIGSFSGEIVPFAERADQWKSINSGARQRLCMIYRNKAHYDAMLENGRKIVEENKENGIERKTKPSGKSSCAGQAEVYLPEDEPDELYEAVNNYADNCAGAAKRNVNSVTETKNLLNFVKGKNQLIALDGMKIRPRSEFKNEDEFLNQFRRYAYPRLTKRLFMQLPDGFCVHCSGFSAKEFFVVLASESKRAAQWETVPKKHRQKRCMIFRFKVDYDNMMAEIERRLLAMKAGKFKNSKDLNEGPPESDDVPF